MNNIDIDREKTEDVTDSEAEAALAWLEYEDEIWEMEHLDTRKIASKADLVRALLQDVDDISSFTRSEQVGFLPQSAVLSSAKTITVVGKDKASGEIWIVVVQSRELLDSQQDWMPPITQRAKREIAERVEAYLDRKALIALMEVEALIHARKFNANSI